MEVNIQQVLMSIREKKIKQKKGIARNRVLLYKRWFGKASWRKLSE